METLAPQSQTPPPVAFLEISDILLPSFSLALFSMAKEFLHSYISITQLNHRPGPLVLYPLTDRLIVIPETKISDHLSNEWLKKLQSGDYHFHKPKSPFRRVVVMVISSDPSVNKRIGIMTFREFLEFNAKKRFFSRHRDRFPQ